MARRSSKPSRPSRPYAALLDGRKRIRLRDFDPTDTAGLDKEESLAELAKLGGEFVELSNLLAFAGQHALLIIVQGRDASGKDGAIRKILEFSNIQSARVEPFKVPTAEELSYDFLHRVHMRVPRKGWVALFNRSHYEDVIATRVHDLVPADVWKARYAHINAFERLLVDSDTIVLKFMLHISRDEQIARLIQREKDPRTAWKLNVADWHELPFWDETTAAYEEAMNRCTSPDLPWYLVPADRKWFRNLAIMERIVLALRPYREVWTSRLEEMGRKTLPEIRKVKRAVGVRNGKVKNR
jgi:PPK2 family polyphosphate:nucleotide phosphotransferase